MQIRRAKNTEIETLVNFQVLMAKETEDMDLDAETVTKGIQRLFDEPVRGNYWVVENEGKVIACALTLSEWSDWRNGEVLWIHSVYVIKEFRGQGVFKKMYASFKQMVAESNILRGLRLYVEKSNHKAQKVYQAVGMTKEHYDMYEWLEN